MTCLESRKLIPLLRELSDSQRSQLTEHVRTCASCAKELSMAGALETMTQNLRSMEPALSDPEHLTAGILSAVSKLQRPRKQPVLNAFIELSSGRAFRLAYVCLVLFSVGIYSVSEFRSFTGLRSLEERMGGTSASLAPRVSYTFQRESIAALVPPELLRGVHGSSDGTISVDRKTLEQGLSRLERSGLLEFRLPPGIANERSTRRILEELGKSIFPKITFLHGSRDRS